MDDKLGLFLENLKKLGWNIINSDLYNPASSLREAFHEVILINELKKFLFHNYPWLKENIFNEILKKLFSPSSKNIFSINEEILNLIQSKIFIENHKLALIDFINPENNSFLAISPFKVQIPRTGLHFINDAVLFINGLPLIIIEGKFENLANPIPKIFNSINKYINHPLFFYNQFIIALDNHLTKYSTITELNEASYEWKNEELNSDIFPMLTKKVLIELIHNFIIFYQNQREETKKIIAHYYQYRAVSKLINFLKEKKENKNAVIYHSHGSGKSLTTLFSVRTILNEPNFKDYTVILITEKREIVHSLEKSAKILNFNLIIPTNINEFKEALKLNRPGLIIGMMKNFYEQELMQQFPVLNTSEKIIILIDEIHRSHYKWLNANLQKSLPNSTKIIFTGTPLEKADSASINYLDKYSFSNAIKDNITLDIRFDTKTAPSEKSEFDTTPELEKAFKDVFEFTSEDEKKRLSEQMARRAYLENKEIIREKAKDMLIHYLTYVFPNKFKAHIVANSHLAAIYYKQELDKAIKELIAQPTMIKNLNLDLNKIKQIKTAVIIRKSLGDPPAYRPFTDETEHQKNINSFQLPIGHIKENSDGNVAIIITTDLLLTGFNAPLEQVIYLDQIIRDHQFIQAISRVNRPYKSKYYGIIIDYVGVCSHLTKALSIFEEEEINEFTSFFKNINDDITLLKSSVKKIEDLFKSVNIFYIDNTDACIDALWNQNFKKEFLFLFNQFQNYMDRLIPKSEALQFTDFLRSLCYISQTARIKYRDESLSLISLSNKLYELVSDFFLKKSIDIRIPPPPLFSKAFEDSFNASTNNKIKAKELISALQEYFLLNKDYDPVFFQILIDNLNKIIADYSEHAERLIIELEKLIEKTKMGRQKEENFGFDPNSELPIFALLMKNIFQTYSYKELNDKQLELLINLTKKILSIFQKEIQQSNFWDNLAAQRKVRTIIMSILMSFPTKYPINAKNLSQQIFELSYHLFQK